jgi:transposase
MSAPKRYPVELRERAVKLYRSSRPRPTFRHLGEQLGVHPEALRGWIRTDQKARGELPDGRPARSASQIAVDEHDELLMLRAHNAELEKENAELRRANGILKAASAFFAQQLDPIRR